MTDVTIDEIDATEMQAVLPELGRLLHECVQDGASIGFVFPFTPEQADSFWRALVPAVAAGGRRMLVARRGGAIVGTVTLVLAQPDNGRHRADIVKLMVHPLARRLGIARHLMLAAEAMARSCDRSLLILDTRTGDSGEPLYRSLGFVATGIVPAYARSIHGVLEDCTFMHKPL